MNLQLGYLKNRMHRRRFYWFNCNLSTL